MIVTLTTRAVRHLDAISDFIARDNPDRAISFARELYDHCQSLAVFPRRHPVVARYRRRTIRKAGYGDYLIFYVVSADRIDVLHILHAARDWPRVIRS